jgi:hypothetical protein
LLSNEINPVQGFPPNPLGWVFLWSDIMGVERVDYYSDEEYEQALYQESCVQQEPDVCPCFKCGNPVYLETHTPEDNICPNCQKGK